jgi:hypothetical protein
MWVVQDFGITALAQGILYSAFCIPFRCSAVSVAVLRRVDNTVEGGLPSSFPPRAAPRAGASQATVTALSAPSDLT